LSCWFGFPALPSRAFTFDPMTINAAFVLLGILLLSSEAVVAVAVAKEEEWDKRNKRNKSSAPPTIEKQQFFYPSKVTSIFRCMYCI